MVPGLTVGILNDGEQTILSLGQTSTEAPRPVTADTLFQIGSITKTYTCLALLSHIESGRYTLDTPIRNYLPHFRVADEAASSQATIRHLLTHVSGWQGDFFVNTGRGDDALAGYVAQMAALPQIAPLGRFLSYNNAGFNLAGHLIEWAGGKPYEAAVKEAVFDPLGLSDTFFFAEDVISRHFAVGHHPAGEGVQVARPWALARCGNPVGGIATTMKDFLQYSTWYLDGNDKKTSQKLIGSDTLSAMLSPQHWIWKEQEAVGFSWFIDMVQGERLISHGGSTNGQVAGLFLVPAKRFAIGFFTNSSRGGSLITLASNWALKEYAGLNPEEEVEQRVSPDLSEVVGRYFRPFAEATLTEADGRLTAEMRYLSGFPTKDDPPYPNPLPMKLAAAEADRFLVSEGPAKSAAVNIIRDDDGQVGWLRLQRRLFSKVPDDSIT
jgi:CubicO group peptidase (beta-lactamase class C family)